MPKKPKAMTGQELRAAIEKLGFASQNDFGITIGTHRRTVQKWTLGEAAVPRHIAMLVNLMLEHDTKPEGLKP